MTVGRQARALVRQVVMPDPWSMAELCRRVGVLRGRPLIVEPSAPVGATASVRREVTRDVITFRADHHNPDHLIAHELGHLLAGDLDGEQGLRTGVSADLAVAVRTMNRECAYDTREERVAEAVADLIMAAARTHSRRATVSPLATSTLRGFGEAMR